MASFSSGDGTVSAQNLSFLEDEVSYEGEGESFNSTGTVPGNGMSTEGPNLISHEAMLEKLDLLREISECNEVKQKLLEENELLRRQLLQGEEDKYDLQMTKEDLVKEHAENKHKAEKLRHLSKELQVSRENLSQSEEAQRQLQEEVAKLQKEIDELNNEKNSNEVKVHSLIREKEAILSELREKEHELETIKYTYLEEIKLLQDKNTEIEEEWIKSKETAEHISGENVHLRTENLELELLVAKLSLKSAADAENANQMFNTVSSPKQEVKDVEEDDPEFNLTGTQDAINNSFMEADIAELINSPGMSSIANSSLRDEISAIIGPDESFVQSFSHANVETNTVSTQCDLEIFCSNCEDEDLPWEDTDRIVWPSGANLDVDIEANQSANVNVQTEVTKKSPATWIPSSTISFGIIGLAMLLQNIIILFSGDSECENSIFSAVDLSTFLSRHGLLVHLTPPLI